MKQPRVFAVCEPTHREGERIVASMDMTPATEFGRLEILLPTNQSLFSTVPTVRYLREKLADFSDDDFILPVGDPVLISMVAMVAADINKGRAQFLKWDKKTKKYYSIMVDAIGRAT